MNSGPSATFRDHVEADQERHEGRFDDARPGEGDGDGDPDHDGQQVAAEDLAGGDERIAEPVVVGAAERCDRVDRRRHDEGGHTPELHEQVPGDDQRRVDGDRRRVAAGCVSGHGGSRRSLGASAEIAGAGAPARAGIRRATD